MTIIQKRNGNKMKYPKLKTSMTGLTSSIIGFCLIYYTNLNDIGLFFAILGMVVASISLGMKPDNVS